MHTVFSRVNNISALLSSCVMGLLAAIAVSSMALQLFEAPLEGGSVVVNNVKVTHGKGRQYKYEHARVDFEIDADLSPLFNWNTKQLFLYLDAEYTNAKGVKNAVVIWDRIVRRKADAKIHVAGNRVQKYQFKDKHTFRDAEAVYTLRYNLMPHVGALVYGVAAATNASVPFPALNAANAKV
ncbi:signal peptidase 22kDa subunit [Mycena albidolilacea]|uniref:Signal peptidase subunit 3 n=1 Tax=Mycena albidolilacea TaxID=1033008 RepID=A0AAD7AI56_9AGAR|nr:signal peptidase 22kDa subunit [Mycena albidolilacea]